MSTYGTIQPSSSLEDLLNLNTAPKSPVKSSPAESSVGGPDISLANIMIFQNTTSSDTTFLKKVAVCVTVVLAAFTALGMLTHNSCAKMCGCVCLTGNATNTTGPCYPCHNSGFHT